MRACMQAMQTPLKRIKDSEDSFETLLRLFNVSPVNFQIGI